MEMATDCVEYKTVVFIFLHTFQVTGIECDVVVKQFMLSNPLVFTLVVRFTQSRKTSRVLLTVSKNLLVDMHFDIHEPIWFKVGMMIDIVELYILMLAKSDFDLHSRSLVCKSAKLSVPVSCC